MQHHALFSLRSEGDLKAEEPQLYEKNYFILMLMIQSIKQTIFHLVEAAFAYFEADISSNIDVFALQENEI